MSNKKHIITIFLIIFMTSISVNILNVQANSNSRVYLNSKKLTLEVGEYYTLKVNNAKKRVKWEAPSDIIEIKISKNKLKIKALRPGKATITINTGKIKISCQVTILRTPFSERASNYVIFTPGGGLRWAKVPGADGYKIYRKKINSKKYKVCKKIKGENSTGDSSKKIRDRHNEKKYVFNVRAYRKVNGKIVYSSWAKEYRVHEIVVYHK